MPLIAISRRPVPQFQLCPASDAHPATVHHPGPQLPPRVHPPLRQTRPPPQDGGLDRVPLLPLPHHIPLGQLW